MPQEIEIRLLYRIPQRDTYVEGWFVAQESKELDWSSDKHPSEVEADVRVRLFCVNFFSLNIKMIKTFFKKNAKKSHNRFSICYVLIVRESNPAGKQPRN